MPNASSQGTPFQLLMDHCVYYYYCYCIPRPTTLVRVTISVTPMVICVIATATTATSHHPATVDGSRGIRGYCNS